MNGRSGLTTFLLFLLLAVMILFQILSMIQADRLYERLNTLINRWQSSPPLTAAPQINPSDEAAQDLPMEPYPGDQGDWLVWHLRGEPRTMNPYSVEGDLFARAIHTGNIFERLFEYDIDVDYVKLKPWLAESLETSEDGLQMTVKLRDDVHFSDGVPVTADDVVFTYQTIMNPGVDAANTREYYRNIADVVKIDDRTVKFVCSELYWKTLEVVGIFEVLPKHIYQFDDPEEFNNRRSNPVGSGPYVFERWDVGQQIVLRRNQNYWGEKPKIDKIVYRFITNATAALQALRSGDIDYMEPSSEQYDEMVADQEFKEQFYALSFWQPSEGFAFIGWNQATDFFKDKLVRRAMTHILDRQAIVDYIMKGRAKTVTGPFYIYGKLTDPNVEPWPYDLEKAAELLDEAGWVDTDSDGIRDKNGKPFRFRFTYASASTIAERTGKLLKDSAAKVGIDVIPDPLEWSIFTERLNNRQFEAATLIWGGTIESDPHQIWHSSQMEGRGNNFISFSNPEADALIEQARRTLDPEKRYELYRRFHRLLHEEQPYTFLFTRPALVFLNKRFENVEVHKLGFNHHEWYVPREKQKYK